MLSEVKKGSWFDLIPRVDWSLKENKVKKGSEIYKEFRLMTLGRFDDTCSGEIWLNKQLCESRVVPEEKWQRITAILEDIIFLYKEYGLEDDSKLTRDAIELKKRVLAVKDDFRLEALREAMDESC